MRAVAIAIVFSMSSASAEPIERWHDSSAQLSLAIAANGWSIARELGAPYEMEATPDPAARPYPAFCTLSASPGHTGSSTRADLNAETRRQIGARFYSRVPEIRVERSGVSEINGVAVEDIRYIRDGDIVTLRSFYLHRDGEVWSYSLLCSAAQDDIPRLTTALAIAASLNITERDSDS